MDSDLSLPNLSYNFWFGTVCGCLQDCRQILILNCVLVLYLIVPLFCFYFHSFLALSALFITEYSKIQEYSKFQITESVLLDNCCQISALHLLPNVTVQSLGSSESNWIEGIISNIELNWIIFFFGESAITNTVAHSVNQCAPPSLQVFVQPVWFPGWPHIRLGHQKPDFEFVKHAFTSCSFFVIQLTVPCYKGNFEYSL